MELTLTVHVPRRRPHPVDVVVRWSGRHTAQELRAALAAHLGEPVAQLSSRGVEIGPEVVVGEPPLLHGAEVTVCGYRSCESPPRGAATGLLHVAVVGGPDAAHARILSPPGVQVGRGPASGLVVADDTLSRVHAVLRVDGSGVVVEDVGSTNGVVADGRPVLEPTPVDTSTLICVGASTLRLHRAPGPAMPVVARGDGRLLVQPSGAVPTRIEGLEIRSPDPPPDPHRARIPWVAALVPVPVGLALAYFLGPQLLAFALLGPVMLLAGAVGDRWGAGRARRADAVGHAAAVRLARARLEQELGKERVRLDRAHPDPHAVLVTAEHRLPGLWCGGEELPLRLGIGHAATRVTWVEHGRRSRPLAPRTPVVVSLTDAGCLGVVGAGHLTDAVIRALLGQLCVTQPPDAVGVVVVGARERPQWAWSRRLPHAGVLPWPADDPGGWDRHPGDGAPVRRVLIVPDGPGETAAAHVRSARAAGWLVIVAAGDRSALPAGCGAVLTLRQGGGSLESGSEEVGELVVDGVGPWWADRVSRALAPLTCERTTGGAGGRIPVPEEVGLEELLPPGAVEPEAVVERWRSTTAAALGLPAALAVVGVGPDGPHRVDLVADGPHVLVGGTTGSGKSEFLRTLVTSLAVSSPPRDLNLVLVDFKGGAAFGVCADLPHVVGLVTDLDDHLAARALTSLRAELRRREQLLVDVGVQDIDAYARTARARQHPVPRLVVVVDELRTLVDEVPEFVSGLVRLAAQGRSLGIHLVLATQRPAGAVTAEVQANVSLRIAFRVRDRADSVAIVEDGAAADIQPRTPGRAVARGADGALRPFQAAILGLRPPHDARGVLEVRSADPAPHRVPRDVPDADVDQRARAHRAAQVVAAVASAHRLTGAPDPRRPWAAALPEAVGLGDVASAPTAGPRPPGAVAVGLVDEPDLQRVTALLWRPADGTWLLAGRPGSGRTTALRAIVAAAASANDPTTLHVHLVDPNGGLGDLTSLPHVGTHATGKEHGALEAVTGHLRALVTERRQARAGRASPHAVEPTVLVVVDGWDQLVEAHPEGLGAGVVEDLVRVVRDGAGVGVVAAVSGGRSLFQPRWASSGGSTIALGALDPVEVALAGLRSHEVPREPSPGRGIRLRDRREVQFALVAAQDVRPREPAAGALAPGGPWRFRPLPTRVPMPTTVSGVRCFPVGLFGEAHDVWCWDPDVHGRVLLVAGPVRSGRSTVLRVLARSVAARGRSVLVVSRTADAGDTGAGSITTVRPDDVDALVAARRADPGLAVLVDDGDLLDGAPVAPVLHELLDLVDRDDGLAVVTTTSTALATRFRGLDVAAARRRTGLLLQPGRSDGDLLGAPGVRGTAPLPGRGVFVSAGTATEVQVFLAPQGVAGGSGVGADARRILRRAHPQHRDGGERGEREDEPARERLVALQEPEGHRHQQGAPHEGGRPGPAGTDEPAASERGQSSTADEDEHRRHEHPGGVAALPDDQLVDVERGEPHECRRLDTREGGRETTRAG